MKMKKAAFFLLIAVMLVGCTPSAQATLTDADMATRVAEILVSMPAPTKPATAVLSATLRVVEVTQEATDAPKATAVLAKPSATPGVPTLTQLPSATPTITQTPLPTQTANPQDPRSRLGTPAWRDTMDNGNNWPTGSNDFTAIAFKDGLMKFTGLKDTSGWRLATGNELGDFYIEMTFRTETCSGTDNYGLIFRVPVAKEADRGYLFGFSCDGKYYLKVWDGKVAPKGKMTTLVSSVANAAIVKGSNQTNRMGIMAVGNRLRLYANGSFLVEYKDSTYPAGHFGVFVNPDNTEKLTIDVDEIAVWNNPKP